MKSGKKVSFVTIDNYRIAAVDQLQRYASIMKVPFTSASTPEALIAFFIMLIVSWILSHFTFNYFHPTTGEQIKIINMLAPSELTKFITKMTANFVSFPPLGITVVATLGIGAAEGSGFIRMILINNFTIYHL